jgi:hypothetical protein
MSLWHQLSDAQRDAMVARLVEALAESGVPDHLRDGLLRYFSHGILPGGFLQAVLCNNLLEAIARGAYGNVVALPALVAFLRQEAPGVAWGSVGRVLGWTTTPERLEIEG